MIISTVLIVILSAAVYFYTTEPFYQVNFSRVIKKADKNIPELSNFQKYESFPLDRPECMLVNHNEEFFLSGVGDGSIKKVDLRTGEQSTFLTALDFNPEIEDLSYCDGGIFTETTCGRVLGMRYDKKEENLIIANAYHGIFIYNFKLEKLLKLYEGRKFFNDLVFSADESKIYFTDSSKVYHRYQFLDLVLNYQATGTVNELDLKTLEVKVLVDGISFANGIEATKDGKYLYFAETNDVRLWKYEIETGKKEVVIDNIPCYVDNIELDEDENRLLVSGIARSPGLELIMTKAPQVLQNIVKLPKMIYVPGIALTFPKKGIISVINLETKTINHNIVDPSGEIFSQLASVHKIGKNYYVGTVTKQKGVKFTLEEK